MLLGFERKIEALFRITTIYNQRSLQTNGEKILIFIEI